MVRRLLDVAQECRVVVVGAPKARAVRVDRRLVPRRCDLGSLEAVAHYAHAGRVVEHDRLVLDAVLAVVASAQLLPDHPPVLLAKPAHDSPPDVVAQVGERVRGGGVAD
jgi:hypothetical protein